MKAQAAQCSGSGGVIQPHEKNRVYAAGGTISGTGLVTNPDGTTVEIQFNSDPLTQEQADRLNKE